MAQEGEREATLSEVTEAAQEAKGGVAEVVVGGRKEARRLWSSKSSLKSGAGRFAGAGEF